MTRNADPWKWTDNAKRDYRRTIGPIEVETTSGLRFLFRTPKAKRAYADWSGRVTRWRRADAPPCV